MGGKAFPAITLDLPATAAAAAVAELALRAVRTRTRLRDFKLALHPFLAAQSADGPLHGIGGVHGDKRETTRRPEVRSVGMLTSRTSPWAEKRLRTSSSVAVHGRLPTYILVFIVLVLGPLLASWTVPELPGFKSLTNTTFIRVTYHAFDWTAVLAAAASSSSGRKIALVLINMPARPESAQPHDLRRGLILIMVPSPGGTFAQNSG